MKKIKNMTYPDFKKSFASFFKRHGINDDFDMSYSVINAAYPLLTDKEAAINVFYDIFRYGFMAGYKQKEKAVNDRTKKHIYNENQRKLVELTYYLPFGRSAEYFYTMMALDLHKYGLERLLPKKQRKNLEECVKAIERHNVTKQEEANKKLEQKRTAMTPEEKEQSNLKFEMLQKTLHVENLQTIKKILEIIKEGELS